jgi:hypothetical protein
MKKTYGPALAVSVALLFVSAAVAAAQPSTPDPAAPEGQTSAAKSAATGEPAAPGAQPLTPEAPVGPQTPAEAGEALKVRYDKGVKFATEDGEFSAKLGMRSQVRFESTRPTEPGAEFVNRIYIVRSRLGLEGNAFGSTNRYKIDLSLGDRGSFSFLKEFYVDKVAGPVQIRFGQWKRPFNRQELVSDFSSQFNERANTAEFVGGGRDLGIAIHNGYETSPEGIEWAFGVFNGFSGGRDRPVITTTCVQNAAGITCATPAPTNVPADWGPALVARLGWNSKAIKGYSEGDLEGGPLRYAVAVSYKIDLANFSPGLESSTTENMSHGLEADAMVKVEGLSVEFGGYMMKLKSAGATYGALAQAGMFVIPKHAELAARFAIAPTTGDREQIEARGAFSWYWEGHRWKWATDIGLVKQTGSDPVTMATDDPDYQLRTMAQLTF